MIDNFKTYEVIINQDNDDLGVAKISLVDKPAVKYQFLKFNEHLKFSIEDEEKREVIGVIMVPNLQMFRNSELLGDHYVYYSEETIKNIILKYFKEKRTDFINTNHSVDVNGVFLFESYIVDSKNGITPTYFKDLPDGSWVGRFKIEDELIWERIKANEFNGFSIEGMFEYNIEEKDELSSFLKEIHKELSKIK